jgi:hypothetical protein
MTQDCDLQVFRIRGRAHRSLDLQPPIPCGLPQSDDDGPVQRVDVLGGLIHEYQRAA